MRPNDELAWPPLDIVRIDRLTPGEIRAFDMTLSQTTDKPMSAKVSVDVVRFHKEPSVSIGSSSRSDIGVVQMTMEEVKELAGPEQWQEIVEFYRTGNREKGKIPVVD